MTRGWFFSVATIATLAGLIGGPVLAGEDLRPSAGLSITRRPDGSVVAAILAGASSGARFVVDCPGSALSQTLIGDGGAFRGVIPAGCDEYALTIDPAGEQR